MDFDSETLAAVVKALSRLPGIGAKTAQRLALFLLRSSKDEAENLGSLLLMLKEKVRFCQTLGRPPGGAPSTRGSRRARCWRACPG